jgi:hypothetical protein
VDARTPAQLYARLAGTVLVAAGIVGLFYSTSFGSPGEVRAMLGVFDVNGWANLLHLVTGGLGLLALGYGARTFALGAGVLYLAIGVWGLVKGSAPLDAVPVGAADDALHLALGALGVAAGVARPAT